jgi:hypothetical protein
MRVWRIITLHNCGMQMEDLITYFEVLNFNDILSLAQLYVVSDAASNHTSLTVWQEESFIIKENFRKKATTICSD